MLINKSRCIAALSTFDSPRKPLTDKDSKSAAIATEQWNNLPQTGFQRTLQSLYRDRHNQPILNTLQTALNRPGLISPILFLGPPGTGKTHLLQGLHSNGIELNLSSLLISLSGFHLQDYPLADLLLIDSLHQIESLSAEKRAAFTILFERHYDRQKQIFLSTEIPIQDLHLQKRFQSRLLSGLTLELHLPDKTDRYSFIQKRLQEFDLNLTLDQIASFHLPDDLSYRDLESISALIYVHHRNGWSDTKLKTAIKTQFQSNLNHTNTPLFSIEHIVAVITNRFQVSLADLTGKSRRSEHTRPRHLAMTLAQKHTDLNKSAIARFFKRSDHSVVIHAVKKIESSIQTDPNLKAVYDQLVKDLTISHRS